MACDEWQAGEEDAPEMQAIADYLALQSQKSQLPGPDDFLIEYTRHHEGYSLFFYPFAGRLAHEGLSMLVAQRLATDREITFTLQVNDYGFELMSEQAINFEENTLRPAFDANNLLGDILASMNASELAQRRFRDIADSTGAHCTSAMVPC